MAKIIKNAVKADQPDPGKPDPSLPEKNGPWMDEDHPAYKSGVLNPKDHYKLVRNLSKFSEDAGIPEYMVYTSCKPYTSEDEREFYTRLPAKLEAGVHGAVYLGEINDVHMKFCAIAGAMLRNYISARVIALHDLLRDLAQGEYFDQQVVLIPDFYTATKGAGHKLWDSDAGRITSFLIARLRKRYFTVVYVSDLQGLRESYGTQVGHFFDQYKHFNQGFHF